MPSSVAYSRGDNHIVASANVELVRSIFADWERGDYRSAAWADPEIEFSWADGPTQGIWRGLAAMAEANRNWLEAWQDVRQFVEEYRELDGRRVLVLHRFNARGKRSGIELEPIRRGGAAVFTIHRDKVIRLVHYFDREKAFAELGLAQEGDSAAL